MFILQQFFTIWLLLFILINDINAEWRSIPKRVTAEYGSDLSLLCTFHNGDSDETIVQWLYQNRKLKSHWKPLFLNAQSLTPKEARYSIQQKIQKINQTSIAYSTILTLAKVNDSDEGLYMCKSLSPKTIQMTYQVRVIQSLEMTPKQLIIPTIDAYSVRLNCILKDNHTDRRPHEIFWWHNNRRLGSKTNRYARIIRNVTENSLISTLIYTGKAESLIGKYTCESEPLRRYISIELQVNKSADLSINFYWILIILIFQY